MRQGADGSFGMGKTRWTADLACHASQNPSKWRKLKKLVLTDGKNVGGIVKLAFEEVTLVRMAKT